MKLIVAIFLVSVFVLTSCDGKERTRYTPEEKLKQSELPDSFFLQEKYFPEEYTEVVTDTIIDNKINISIKSYTDMNNNVLNEFKIDTIHYKYFYREIISDLVITLDGKTIFNETIDKSNFKDKEDKLFWEEAIMLGLYLDDTQTTNKHLYFNVSFCMIESETCKDYNLIIDNKGELVIKELEPEEIH